MEGDGDELDGNGEKMNGEATTVCERRADDGEKT